MIAKKRNKPWERVQRLIDVQESLGMSEDEMVSVVTTDLHEEPYTLNEVCNWHNRDNDNIESIKRYAIRTTLPALKKNIVDIRYHIDCFLFF